jgi:LmbE family N-acetylglucosaminyl deacetylase
MAMGGGVLLVGAHPDDIEIAAGGIAARLVRAGMDVLAVVASDETDPVVAATRRGETLAGLGTLGLSAAQIEFLGLADRAVDAAEGADRLTRLLSTRRFAPDLVVTHSFHDYHTDHRAVAEMVLAVVDEPTTVLGMAVVNSVSDSFCPGVLIDTSSAIDVKWRALECHRSQVARGRIRHPEIRLFERAHGRSIGCWRAEGLDFAQPWNGDVSPALGCLRPWFTRSSDHPRTGSSPRAER